MPTANTLMVGLRSTRLAQQRLRGLFGYGKRGSGARCRKPTSSLRHVAVEILQPRRGVAIRRRAPVAARRQRAAGHHLWPVRHRRALELAKGKEALQEHLQPLPDLGERIGAALVGWKA